MGGGNGRRLLLAVAVMLGIAALLAWLWGMAPDTLEDGDNRLELVRYLALLLLVLPALLAYRHLGARTMLRDAAGWIGILGVLVVGYSFRGELGYVWQRVRGEVMPRQGMLVDGGSISFRAARDGHFHVEAAVGDVPVRFMVDTGASDVVLNARDARRLGFDPSTLAYNRTYQTANGPVDGAPVILPELRIGPVLLRQVRASVNRGDMGSSLLGMSFLGRLSGFAVSDGTLTLRQ